MSLYELAYVGSETDGQHPVRVEGKLPEGLRGTLLRSGPGALNAGSDPIAWLDGPSLVVKVSFARDGVNALSRYVDSATRKAELAAGRMVQRRVATNLPSRWANLFNLKLGNPANHDVYRWGRSLWASGAGQHYELDPEDLFTRGETRWPEVSKPGDTLCDMPGVDPEARHLISFVIRPGRLRKDRIIFLERDEKGAFACSAQEVPLRGRGVPVHDLGFTRQWYVGAEIAVRPNILKVLWGKKPLWSCFEPDVPASNLLLVPRNRPGSPVRVQLNPKHAVVFHIANAFDDGKNVVVDGVSYEEFPDFAKAAGQDLRARTGVDWTVNTAPPRVMRWIVDPGAGRIVSEEHLGTGETPSVDQRFHGKKSSVIFLNAPCSVGGEPAPSYFFYYHGLVRVESGKGTVSTWSAGANCLCGPPAFAPRSSGAAEGDGWVLTWVIDGKTGATDVAILDGAALDKGPVAWVRLGIKLPVVSHTHWLDDV